MATVPAPAPDLGGTGNPDISEAESAAPGELDPLIVEKMNATLSDEVPLADEAIGPTPPTPEELAALLAEHNDDEEDDGEEGDGEDAEGADAAQAAEGADGEAAPKDGEDGDAAAAERTKRARRGGKGAAERRRLERENRALKQRLEAAAAAPVADDEGDPEAATAAAAAEETPPPRPKLEDFDYDQDKWAEALTDWTDKEIDRRARVAAQAAREEERVRTEAENTKRQVETLKQEFASRETEARDRYDDYDDVVYDQTIVIPPIAADVIYASEVGPDLAYYLATHQDEAKQIAAMSDAAAARTIGRIEARIEAEQASPTARTGTTTQPKPNSAEPANGSTANGQAPAQGGTGATRTQTQPRRPATRAPEPIRTVGGGGAVHRSPDKMDYEEYKKGRMDGSIR